LTPARSPIRGLEHPTAGCCIYGARVLRIDHQRRNRPAIRPEARPDVVTRPTRMRSEDGEYYDRYSHAAFHVLSPVVSAVPSLREGKCYRCRAVTAHGGGPAGLPPFTA